jgi:hypothetical protein
MPEYEIEKAVLEMLLDDDHEAAAELLAKLNSAEVRRLAHATQDLVSLCHQAWTARLAWRLE